MQREITDLTPDPTNPAISRASFADGSIYALPTATIQPLYEQQMQARRGQMTAQNAAPNFTAWAPGEQSSAQKTEPQVSDVGLQYSAAPPMVSTPPEVNYTPAEPPAVAPSQPQRQAMDPDLAELTMLRQAGHRWTLQDEAEHRLHPELTRAQLLAYRAQGGGQRAVTQADLQRAASQSVAVPVAQTTTVSGKAPVSDAELQRVTDSQIKAADAGANAMTAQHRADAATADARYLLAQNEAERQKHELATREAAWNDRWSKLQQQLDPNNEQNQVDPDRYMSNKGAFYGLLAMIGGFMRGFAAGYNGQQPGQSPIDRAIERDIRAQEVAIQTNRANANSQLMRLSQEFGSLEAGKIALGIAQRQALENKAASLQLQRMDPVAASNVEAFRADAQAKIAAQAAQLKALYGGTISETQQAQMMRPQAARAGGPRYNERAIQGGINEQRGEVRKDVEVGMKAEAPNRERAERLGERVSQLGGALDAAREYFQSIGLTRDPESGKWVKPAGFDHPLYGPVDTTVGHWSDRTNVARAAKKNANEAFGRAQSGAAISKEEREAFDEMIGGSNWTDADAAANELERALTGRMKYLGAGAGGQASDLVTQGVTRERQKTFNQNRNEAAVQPYIPGTK